MRELFIAGVLRERWDDTTRQHTTFDDKGAQTGSRPYTAEENTRADNAAAMRGVAGNRATIEQQAASALAGNKAFAALSAPTQAQTLAQVKALSLQNNGIIRLRLGKLDATD